jgi:hypothetical protein
LARVVRSGLGLDSGIYLRIILALSSLVWLRGMVQHLIVLDFLDKPWGRGMWLLKGRMSLAMPEALAHANLWEAKARNLAWSEELPPER